MSIAEDMMKAIKLASDIRELSGTSGEFFAMLLVADLNSMEKTILDGMTKYQEMKKTDADMPEIDMARVGDKAALIGCLIRFRDDLADNTMVGKRVKDKYNEMKAEKTS